MIVAMMGKYYKTSEAALTAFDKLSEWEKKHQSIVEFENAYLIVSNEQIKAVNKNDN